MHTRIGLQIVAAVGLVTAIGIGLLATLTLRTQRREMIEQLTQSADLLSETVKRSTQDYMLENRRERIRRQIEAIGREQRIERVRVFNKQGSIVFSSDPADVGRTLDKQAESCFACHAQGQPIEKPPVHERARIFTAGLRPPRARHRQPDPEPARVQQRRLPRPRSRADGARRPRRHRLPRGRRPADRREPQPHRQSRHRRRRRRRPALLVAQPAARQPSGRGAHRRHAARRRRRSDDHHPGRPDATSSASWRARSTP